MNICSFGNQAHIQMSGDCQHSHIFSQGVSKKLTSTIIPELHLFKLNPTLLYVLLNIAIVSRISKWPIKIPKTKKTFAETLRK